MIIDANLYDKNMSLQADICILGAGIAGIVLAKELLPHFENIALIESGGTSYSAETQSLYSPETKPSLYPDPEYSRLRMLGGSSNHWENGTEPLDPIDFEKREWVDNSGWPIEYSDVSYYYIKAAQYCGVGTDGYDVNKWTKTLNTKDLFSKSSLIESSIVKNGIPPTRFFEKYGDELISSNNLTVYKNANVTDIHYDPESLKVTTITFQSLNKIKHSISAKIFIMCLGGIENARMMLEFNAKYNNVLGNQNDNVGRYFMDHPTIRAAHLYPFDDINFDFYKGKWFTGKGVVGNLKLSKDSLKENNTINMRVALNRQSKLNLSHGISSLHILSEQIQDSDIADNFGIHITNIIKDLDTVTDTISRKSFDYPLFDDSDKFGGYQLLAMMEQTPSRNNRIRLGADRDALGIRKVIIDWEVTQKDKDMAWSSLDIFAKSVGIEALGRVRLLKERESRIWDSQLGFGHHHIGTTRMGYTQKDGVVDSNQKVFGSKNLYISGSSVFPTGGHVPPTLTIVALTIRLADHIKSHYLL